MLSKRKAIFISFLLSAAIVFVFALSTPHNFNNQHKNQFVGFNIAKEHMGSFYDNKARNKNNYMNGHMYGNMNEHMNGHMYGNMNEHMYGNMNEHMYGNMNERMYGNMNRHMYGNMNDDMNRHMYGNIKEGKFKNGLCGN